MFSIENKVALVTGGASGIGLKIVQELLKNGLKGVIIADINEEFGKTALNEISQIYGYGRAFFHQTDVTEEASIEAAFNAAIVKFNQLDIVVNNAGIMNDKIWKTEIDINCKGLVHGTLLALHKYLSKYKIGEEGVVVNMSSIVGFLPLKAMPVYCGTKSFVIQFSRSIASEINYEKTKVKIIVICPGATDTPLANLQGKYLNQTYEEIFKQYKLIIQPSQYVAKEIVSIIQKGKNGSLWKLENSFTEEIIYENPSVLSNE